MRGPLHGWQREALKPSYIHAVAANHMASGKRHVSEQRVRATNLLDNEPDPVAVLPDLPREEPADGNADGGQFVGQPADERAYWPLWSCRAW